MFTRTYPSNFYPRNLANPHTMINHIRLRYSVIVLIGLLFITMFANFTYFMPQDEKDSNFYHQIEKLRGSSKILLPIVSSDLTSNPENQLDSSNAFIDRDKMKNETIRELDKNADLIVDNLEGKIDLKSSKGNQIVSVIINTKSVLFENEMTIFEKLGGKVNHIWDNIADVVYGFCGEIGASKLREFTKRAEANIELIEENLPAIRNSDVATHLAMVRTHVWDDLNYTGDPNISVAILDTGIDDSHSAFTPGYEDLNWSKKIIGWYDATNDGSTTPEDYIGHGSHVAGIVSANEFNDSYDDERIVSTWSTSYDPGLGGASGYFAYTLWVNRTGTIDISYVWRGEQNAEGTDLTLVAPNGTSIAEDATGNSNMTVSHTIISESEFGYWEVRLGVYWGFSGGMLDIAGVNKYPYPDPTDSYSRFAGVAPNVKLVGVKIFDNTGYGNSGDVIEAFNWVKNNKETYHIVIASGSFSFSGTVASVDSAATALVNSGITVVLSAGNDGQGGNSIYSPGQVDGVITVAASDDYDTITDYSSEGPGEVSNTTKPDITAPGGYSSQGGILQVDSNDADSKTYTWSDKYLNDFTNIQGTSMSCPFVSGSLSLLIQAMGGYEYWSEGYGSAANPFKVKQMILMTANEIYSDNRGGKDPVEGYGRLNIYAAIEAIENTYGIETLANGNLSSDLGEQKVWAQNVGLIVGTNYTFILAVPDGADFDLFLYEPDPNQFGEPVLIANSTNLNPGVNETINFAPEISGTYFLVVKTSFSNTGSGVFNLTSTSRLIRPLVNIDSPTNTTYTTSTIAVTLSGDAVHNWYYIENVDDTNISWTVSENRILLDGTYTLHAYGNDTYGFETHNSLTFTIDTTPPTVNIDSPTNITYSRSTIPIHAINISDVHSAWFRYENGSWSSNYSLVYDSGYGWWEAEGLLWIDGSYLVQVFFNDSVGNEAYDEEWFTVDTTAPAVTIDSPNNTTYTTASIVIYASNSTTVHKAWYRYKNGSWSVNYSLTYDLTNKRWEVEDLTWIDGIYLVQVFFNDSFGNEAYSQEWFSVDTTAPEVTIEYPANTTYTTSFIDTYATNTSFVYKGWYRYRNGSWSDNYSLVYNSENTRWESGGLSWIDGSYCIQVFFNDSFGNEAFDEEWFTVDTTPPFVTISSPINITYTTVRVNIYATNDTHVDTAWYRFKNGSWSINYSLTFDFYDNRWETEEMIWIDGYYLVQVFFNDTVGNEAYSQEWFSIDTTAPEVSIVNLVNTTYTISFIDIYAVNTTFVHKGWYRYRNGSWSKNYSLIYNSENTRWESGSLIWIDGSYCIQVFFNDSFGNEAYDEEWFTIDTTAPLVTITNPNNTTYTTISVAIYATNSSVVHKAWTRYKNGSWSENYSLTYDSFDERWELEFLSWIDGIYLIQVFFNDSVGNEDYNEEWFTVDTTAPKVTISSPGNITYAITIVKIYASNDTNVEKAWARFKNSSWSTNFTMIYDPIDVRWEVEHLKFNNGSYLIQVFFIDSVGNEDHSSVTFTVYVDILPPTITLKTLNNGSVLTSNTPIVILVTDFNLDKVIINWDGGVNLTLPSPYETILPQLETEHVLFVYAIDTSNNSIIKRFVFITDDTSPDISLETITYSAVGLNIADDNLNTVLYSWDNNDYKILDIPHQAELPPLDGNYTLYIYANDSAGNMASEFFNILVDRVSPVIELLSPKNGSVLHSSAEIMFNVTDEQLDSILFNWDRTTNNSIFLPYMAKLPEGEGNHFLYIFANDSVGLWSQAVFVFTTDDVRPEIKLRDHLNMSTLPPNTNISLIISDANLDAVLYNWDDSQEGILFEFTTVLPKEEGKHILYVFANDTAGNWATVQFILYTSAKTTKSSSELESSQGSSSSDETDGLINTQAILIPGGFSIGILLSILFVSFGIIASRLIRRRFSSD